MKKFELSVPIRNFTKANKSSEFKKKLSEISYRCIKYPYCVLCVKYTIYIYIYIYIQYSVVHSSNSGGIS